MDLTSLIATLFRKSQFNFLDRNSEFEIQGEFFEVLTSDG